jgi:glycosyltransferase involved in cell wall biosynthesis
MAWSLRWWNWCAQLQANGHEVHVIHPGQFRTRPCPGYAGIDGGFPARQHAQQLDRCGPRTRCTSPPKARWDGLRVHIACAASCAFTTAFHTKFPEILHAALAVPVSWGYALFRHFHVPAAGVMVPTQGVLDMLQARGFRNLRTWTHGVDTRLFSDARTPQVYEPLWACWRARSLFVGRLSYEKNIEAFLQLDFPGTKVVCGVGPLEAQLRERYPGVRWLGLLPRDELARVYAAADLFVFPSRSETFGLVMLEAMATGTPVAAYPVDGPLEVLGQPDCLGGSLNEDLQQACFATLAVPRHEARTRALQFSWAEATRLFTSHLVPVSQGCHEAAEHCHKPVTQLTSSSSSTPS